MKNSVSSFLIAIVLCIMYNSCTNYKNDWSMMKEHAESGILTDREKSIVGVWEDIPSAASGWSITYQFFRNGSYIYNYSTMHDEPWTEIAIKGKYELDQGIILLSPLKKLIIKNGVFDSSGMGVTLISGSKIWEKVNNKNVIKEIYMQPEIQKFENDNESALWTIKIVIGSKEFFKKSNDPNEYP